MHLYHLIKIYHVVQELRAFTLTDHERTDSHIEYSADTRVVQSKFT